METTGLVIDSNVFIGYKRRRPDFIAALNYARARYACYVTAVNVYEVIWGAHYAQQVAETMEMLSTCECLPFDKDSAETAARIGAALTKQGRMIDVKDLFIASICLRFRVPLLTDNVSHFARVPSLQVFGLHDFSEAS